jgi:hypothetical protein
MAVMSGSSSFSLFSVATILTDAHRARRAQAVLRKYASVGGGPQTDLEFFPRQTFGRCGAS